MTRIALYQSCTGIDIAENIGNLERAVRDAALGGAAMLFTPEMSGLLDRDRARAAAHIMSEAEDAVVAAMCAAARAHDIWIALGSHAVKSADGRFANRSFVITNTGEIVARYDKIHMFDVALANGEAWRESAAYAPGDKVVSIGCPVGHLGLAICYDIRFPAVFSALGARACDAIAIPAAFTKPTGAAHWHILQRARAIENSAFVISAAQAGTHRDGRQTFGHSLVIDPWGDIVLDMGGDDIGVGFAEIDLARVKSVREQVPSLANRREIPN